LQISKETEKFAQPGGYRTVLLVGGQDIDEQSMKLRAGCEIVVATPGRLKDCLDSQLLVLNQCNFIVLDEADRMIEEGFELELLAILDSMPKDTLKSEEEELAEQQERQAAALLLPDAAPPAPRDMRNRYRTTFMFSATMPPPVERLSRRYLRRAGQIIVGAVGRAVDLIKQTVLFARSDHDKKQHLEELIRNGPPPPIIVFVNQRKKTDSIATLIESLGLSTTTLQGGLAQDVREECLQEFRDGKAQVLVATDVAGRGIDVKGVTHVINYDLPKDIDSYTHRIGRTGRAGASGLATSFLTNDDADIMYDLKKMLQETNNSVPSELASHEASKVKPGTIVQQPRHKTIIYA
jgi:ATP-dependent RNA helicase DDX23/PRP28